MRFRASEFVPRDVTGNLRGERRGGMTKTTVPTFHLLTYPIAFRHPQPSKRNTAHMITMISPAACPTPFNDAEGTHGW